VVRATADCDYTAYFYLAYTTETVALLNPTSDHWMNTTQATVFNFNPQVGDGIELRMGDANLYENPEIVTDMARLAPGQCLLMSTAEQPSHAQPCDRIAQLTLSPAVAFWLFEFEVLSETDGLRRKCPAATEGRLTLCIVPQ
jgi:hypothetical protein